MADESHIVWRCRRTCVHFVQWLWPIPLLPEQTFRLSGFPAEKIRADLLADGDCLYGNSGMDAVSGKRGADAAVGQPFPL